MLYINSYMKRLQQFLTYNNAVPIMLGVIFLGSAVAFAQNVVTNQTNSGNRIENYITIDTTAIQTIDFIDHKFNPTVDLIQETDRGYRVTIGLDDYQVVKGRWAFIRGRYDIEIRRELVVTTQQLQDKINIEVNDLVESRRMTLAKAQENAIQIVNSSNTIDLGSVLGGVAVREETVVNPVLAQTSGFVQGSHRPEDRVNPERSVITQVVGLVPDPLTSLVSLVEEPVTVAVAGQSFSGLESEEVDEDGQDQDTNDNQIMDNEPAPQESATSTVTITDAATSTESATTTLGIVDTDNVASSSEEVANRHLTTTSTASSSETSEEVGVVANDPVATTSETVKEPGEESAVNQIEEIVEELVEDGMVAEKETITEAETTPESVLEEALIPEVVTQEEGSIETTTEDSTAEPISPVLQ